jgi:integrase
MARHNTGPRLRAPGKRPYYYIVWTERGRSWERTTGTRDRREAEIALATFIGAYRRSAGPRDPAEVLISDVLADYAEHHGPETEGPFRIAAALKPLVSFFQSRTVAEVTPATCRAYAKKRARSAGTIRRELGVLRAAINYAHREGQITRIVALELPEPPEPRDQWLTLSEAACLLRASLRSRKARLYLPLFILLGLYTGARSGAIRSLRWCQVDLVREHLDFNKPGSRRTKKRRPVIPIPPKLLGHLRRARRRGVELGYVLNINGKRIGDIGKSFESACRRARLSGVTPHVLKHTCATWMMQRGVPKWEAAGYLATSEQTLQRVYEHHHPDHLQAAVIGINRRSSVRNS